MLEEVKTAKDNVEYLLTKYPKFRDSDNKLLAFVWSQETADQPDLTAKEFFDGYAQGKFSKAESLRRARQLLQQKNPSLKGENHEGRMAEEKVVREGIKDL